MTAHKFVKVAHGWWFFRSYCTCGWVSHKRWNSKVAEADLMTHQHVERAHAEAETGTPVLPPPHIGIPPGDAEALLTEVRTLRARLDELNTLAIPRHDWLKIFIRDLEVNPYAQYRVHYFGVIYWLINFPLVTLLFFLEPALWLKLGIFITLVYSIYANFATDYGSMSAAMAAYRRNGTGLPELPGEHHSPPLNGGGDDTSPAT